MLRCAIPVEGKGAEDNYILRWFKEHFEVSHGQGILAQAVEEHFDEWCVKEQLKPPTRRALRETLAQLGIKRQRVMGADRHNPKERAWRYQHMATIPDDVPETTADEIPF